MNQDPNNQNNQEQGEKKRLSPAQKKTLFRLILLVVNTLLFFTVYRVLLYYGELTDQTFGSFIVMAIYTALLCGFVLAYLIYNRFLYRKGVTAEQLPAEWDEEKKAEFLADGERRLEKSKWMLTVIIPLLLTFMIDAIDLFILDLFR